MVFKKLNQLDEDNFSVLRGPLESNRQSPSSLAGALLISIFLQGVPIIIAIFILMDGWINTFILVTTIIYFSVTGVVILLSIIYSIPKVYKWGQKMQYFLSILVIQYLIFSFYLIILYFLSEELLYGYGSSRYDTTEQEFLVFIGITNIIGIAVFIMAFVRFYSLLKKGAFQIGSKREELRGKLEGSIPNLLPGSIVVGTCLSLGIGAQIKLLKLQDFELFGIFTLFLLLFYTMMFILPEQLVILYCKRRFRGFNYNKAGVLYPSSKKDSS